MFFGFNFLVRRSKKLEDRYVGNAFIFEPGESNKILSYDYNIIITDKGISVHLGVVCRHT